MAESNNHATDTKVEQLAHMYAKAFVDAASNAHQLDALAEEFEALVNEVLDQHPQFEALVNSSRIKKLEKQQILDRVFGGRTSDMVLQFLKVLATHERLDCLRPIANQVHLLHRERRGVIPVKVRTTIPLDDHLADQIRNTLRPIVGGEPELSHQVDESLLGGMVIRVEDTVFDGSISTKLAKLRRQIIQRSVQEIQSRSDRFGDPGVAPLAEGNEG